MKEQGTMGKNICSEKLMNGYDSIEAVTVNILCGNI